jgi:hypothetical protein
MARSFRCSRAAGKEMSADAPPTHFGALQQAAARGPVSARLRTPGPAPPAAEPEQKHATAAEIQDRLGVILRIVACSGAARERTALIRTGSSL